LEHKAVVARGSEVLKCLLEGSLVIHAPFVRVSCLPFASVRMCHGFGVRLSIARLVGMCESGLYAWAMGDEVPWIVVASW
jgi:hypothetical protein